MVNQGIWSTVVPCKRIVRRFIPSPRLVCHRGLYVGGLFARHAWTVMTMKLCNCARGLGRGADECVWVPLPEYLTLPFYL
jgi:hypothetical protein